MQQRMNKRWFLGVLILCIAAGAAFGQLETEPGEPNPAELGQDTAQQKLMEVSVNKFEDAGFWYGAMPVDQGIVVLRRFQGSPAEKEVLEQEVKSGIQQADDYVLGTRVSFFRRGVNSFSVNPVRPIPIPGLTKTVSVWVAGRNTRHNMVLLLKDYNGKDVEVNMGMLNFSGWKKMTVAIPPGITQKEPGQHRDMGVAFNGFRIDCDLEQTFGDFYVYFDDMRAVTDLFSEEIRDPDDMLDSW